MRRPEDSISESLLFFHRVGPENQTRVTGLGLCPLSHPMNPSVSDICISASNILQKKLEGTEQPQDRAVAGFCMCLVLLNIFSKPEEVQVDSC